MKIYEFIDTYCQDILTQGRQSRKLMALEGLPCDDHITAEDGTLVPVVQVGYEQIPVNDFITLDRPDFLQAHKVPGAEEAFDNYISALIILEGPEALSRVRNALQQEAERLQQDVELITSI